MFKSALIVLAGLLVLSCVEEVETIPLISSSSRSDDILIVEAVITNLLERQEIKLSLLSELGTEIIIPASNANITVKDDLDNSFVFIESEPGIYLSQNEFSAQQNVHYELLVELSTGETIESDKVVLNGISSIQDLVVRKTISSNGINGIGIFATQSRNSNDNTVRYSYDETYKIIAPSWAPFEFVILNEFQFDVQARQQEERICFNTVVSNDIILADNLESESGLEVQLVRFLGKDNFIISHRYSILVKQFLHTRRGYDFYRTLDSFSSNENLFTEVQPGLIEGNVSSTNSSLKVIGLFDVVSVDERRVFFNYEDFFPDEPIPEYPFNCRIFSPTITDEIFNGGVEYVGENDNPREGELPIFVTTRACGDCTLLGTNIIPDFWEE